MIYVFPFYRKIAWKLSCRLDEKKWVLQLLSTKILSKISVKNELSFLCKLNIWPILLQFSFCKHEKLEAFQMLFNVYNAFVWADVLVKLPNHSKL